MTRNESSFLAGSMIRANTNARSTSSPPVAVSNPSTRYARDKATRRRAIRDEVIASGPPDARHQDRNRTQAARSDTQRRRRLQHREFSIVVC
jgi:hypothetical protein